MLLAREFIDYISRQTIKKLSPQWLETTDPQVVEEFEAFAAGWNQFLDDNTDLTGWCAGEPWVFKVSGADVYSYARAIALTASSAQLVSYIAAATPPEPAADTTVPSTDDADTSSTTTWATHSSTYMRSPLDQYKGTRANTQGSEHKAKQATPKIANMSARCR